MRRRSFAMLKRGDIVKLVRAVAETRETEIDCDECFEWLDSFAEAELSGAKASTAMPPVGDHLSKCEECRSKLEALLTALRGT
jgi:Zn finger protein HypA/HybF involved in hydrogenase expression